MEQVAVCTGTDLIDDIWLEITVDRTGDVFSLAFIWDILSVIQPIMIYVLGLVCIPVSEKKVLKPWSGSAALRSSVKYPSGCGKTVLVKVHKYSKVYCYIRLGDSYLNTMLKTVELQERKNMCQSYEFHANILQ